MNEVNETRSGSPKQPVDQVCTEGTDPKNLDRSGDDGLDAVYQFCKREQAQIWAAYDKTPRWRFVKRREQRAAAMAALDVLLHIAFGPDQKTNQDK